MIYPDETHGSIRMICNALSITLRHICQKKPGI